MIIKSFGRQIGDSLNQHPDSETYTGLVIIRFDGPLYFATANALRDKVRTVTTDVDPPVTKVLIDMEGVNYLDLEGCDMLNEIASNMKGAGVEIHLARVKLEKLQRYSWPGNVRELKHAVEGALIAAQGKKLNFDLPQIAETALTDFKSFEEMERDYILRVLKAKNWKIGGNNSAASALGMHVNTLRNRMKKLGIKKPQPKQ